MADKKVSQLPLLGSGSLDPAADFLLISDVSAALSKKIKPSGVFSGALPAALPFWDFTTGVLPSTVTFTRASSGYRFNSSGVLVSETTDVARFQYDPVTLTARGLLVEEANVGMFTQTEVFSHTDWAKTFATVTGNTATAPDGTATGDSLIEDGSAASTHTIRQSGKTYTSGLNYTISCFAKANTRNWIYFELTSTYFGSSRRVWFNLATGVVGTINNAAWRATIQDVGGGWYHCSVVGLCTSSGAAGTGIIAVSEADGVPTHNGDGVSGAYIWGANLTQSDCITSYVQAAATTVARAADVATLTNPLVLTDQCWVIRARTPRKISGGAYNVAIQMDDGTNSNRRKLRYDTDGTLRLYATTSGVTTCSLNLGAVAADTDFTVAVRWADNNFAASLNGGAIVTDVSGINPFGLTTARIGNMGGSYYWNSTIKTIETRRTATDTELPLLSS